MREKKLPLITSDRVYYQIKWHSNADPKKAYIIYLNYGDYKKIPYHDWIPMDKGGEIPWHRIYKFIYSDKILWDRDERIYDAKILEEIDAHSNISVIKYQNKKWNIIDDKKYDILPDNIKIVSLNCLVDLYDKNITNSVPRLPVIVSYLKSYDPDIICLQEINIPMKKFIIDDDFIKKNYYVSGNEPKIYGQMMLTKYKPVSQNLISFDGNHMKKYLQMTFSNREGEIIEIYNIHLTSNQQINSDKKREGQIEQLFTELKSRKVIIVGDFNNSDNVVYYSFRDIWELLRPNEDGFTFDYTENKLTSRTTKSFLRTRIDKILFREIKPVSIDIIFDKAINNVWASDHFGLLAEFSTNEIYETEEYVENSNTEINNMLIKPGTILCFVLEPHYWPILNSIRMKYDDGYNKIAPHVTLFQRFLPVEGWHLFKSNINPCDKIINFDKVEIFNLTNKYAVVLTSSEGYYVENIRRNIGNKLKVNIESKPHITLGVFDNEKKANNVKNSVELMLEETIIKVDLSVMSFMKKIGDQYQIYEYIGKNKKIDPIELVNLFSKNMGDHFEINIIGSRAYGINDSDYDIVLTGDVDENMFNTRFILFAKMSPYFIYAKLIESKVQTVNLITCFGEEINLIYAKKVSGKINNYLINNSIGSIEEIHKILVSKERFDFFSECYNLIRIWAKRRHIYGSKYGYLNGISWLIITLNLFLKSEYDDKKDFIRKFFDYYSSYDWAVPINIKNYPVKKETRCDEMICICNVLDKDKLVRTLTPTTWKVIRDEFKRGNELINDLNKAFETKKLPEQYVQITINDDFRFNRIEKQNQLTADMWKLCLKTPDVIPYINWLDKDGCLIYKFGISKQSDFDIIYGYFRKYLCNIELKNRLVIN